MINSRQCSGRPGAPADQLSRCVEPIAPPNSRRFFSRRKSAGNRFSCCSFDPSDYCEAVLESSRVFRFSSLHIARGDTTDSEFSAFAIGRFSPLSWRSLASAVIPTGATALFLLEVSRFRPFRRPHPFSYCPLAFGWRAVHSRHFCHLPRPSPRWSMPRAPSFFSCGRATAPPVIRSPVHLPRNLRPAPKAHSRPSSNISRFHSRMYCHAFLCSRHSESGEPRVVQPFILARYPP